MKQAFKKIKYDFAKAEVDSKSTRIFNPVFKALKKPVNIPNTQDSDLLVDEKYTIEIREESEYAETNCTGWNISGGLSAKYQGAGANTTVGYAKTQIKSFKKVTDIKEGFSVPVKFSVPPKHFRTLTLSERHQWNECDVKNIQVKFPKKKRIKCEVHNNQDSDPQKFKMTYFYLKDVLKDYIEDAEADKLTAWLEGKYVWVEVGGHPIVSDAKPI